MGGWMDALWSNIRFQQYFARIEDKNEKVSAIEPRLHLKRFLQTGIKYGTLDQQASA